MYLQFDIYSNNYSDKGSDIFMKIQKLKADNIENIVIWCENKDADFLNQWAGRGYEYPLTRQQIEKRLSDGAEIYEIDSDEQMIGTIEIITREEESEVALIGRFLLNPELTGKGLGTQVLNAFIDFCKTEFSIRKIRLFVFDFNVAAFKCYKKCGFFETETVIRPNGWKAICMEKEAE